MSDKENKQSTVRVSRLYGDYLLMLAAPLVIAVCYYGARPLAVVGVGILSAVASDLVLSLIVKKEFLLKDLSNAFIGAVIALMLPAGVPLYVPALASLFAVLVAKEPFGGSLRAPFVPAAAGMAFATVCFKEQVFDYSYNSGGMLMGESSLASLLLKGNAVYLNTLNAFDILSGNVAGPMGAGCVLIMLALCIFLIIRRKGALLAVAGFIASCALYAAISPRVNASVITSIVLELSSGYLLFAAVFLLTDYATQPKNYFTRVIYGAVCGILCMLMRGVGAYEETVCFAVLLANAFTPVIDSAVNGLAKKKKKSAPVREEASE